MQNTSNRSAKSVEMSKKIILHLPAKLKKSVDAGQHNFFKILRKTFEDRGYSTHTRRQNRLDIFSIRSANSLHIHNIDGAVGKHSLNVRLAHFFPFWSLEKAGTRRQPRISGLKFDPAAINGLSAQDFYNKICVRNLKGVPPPIEQSDFIFMPLQGRLLFRRDWQYFDVRNMIDITLSHDKTRQILLKLHPRENYSTAEKTFINSLLDNPRIELTEADTQSLLSQCAYVVTQNSAVGFEALLHQKPTILFAKSSFSHICQTVDNTQIAADAFAKTLSERPAYEKYIYWHLQLNCINAGRDDAPAKIVAMARDGGWDI